MALAKASSAYITDLQAIPAVRDTAGKGPAGVLLVQEATITVVSGADVHSTYSLARVPSGSKIKRIVFNSPTQGATGIFDIGAFYANDGTNGLSVAAGHVYNGADLIGLNFFAQNLDTDAGQGVYADLIPGGGFVVTNATLALRQGAGGGWDVTALNQAIWQSLAIGVGTVPSGGVDPNCNIDIVATLNEAAGTGAGAITVQVFYVI